MRTVRRRQLAPSAPGSASPALAWCHGNRSGTKSSVLTGYGPAPTPVPTIAAIPSDQRAKSAGATGTASSACPRYRPVPSNAAVVSVAAFHQPKAASAGVAAISTANTVTSVTTRSGRSRE